MNEVLQPIIIGGVGGSIAGITVWVVQHVHTKVVESIHKKRVYRWLDDNSGEGSQHTYRTTRAIASYNDLTLDRVCYICSSHPQVRLSTGDRDDRWEIRKPSNDQP